MLRAPSAAVLALALYASSARAAPPDTAVVDQWALPEGLALEQDTAGFALPAALAFVPEPGDAPDDPLYFVVELRGRVKVVTKARAVHTFAEGFAPFAPAHELPHHEGEGGSAGICLDPEHGYVFVTYMYQDAKGVLRNGMTRFSTTPRTFGLRGSDPLEIRAPFAHDVAALAHQAGGCSVHAGKLYLSIGDGEQPLEARNLDSTLGKVLRLELDGSPAADNPFAADAEGGTRAYVWAYGLRNPFGQRFVGERLFVSDNGNLVDRFLAVEPGGDHLWQGHDWSITARADFVFTPSQGPVQVDYLPPGDARLPEPYRGAFLVALAGKPDYRGERFDRAEGVAAIPYDLSRMRVASPPSYLVRFRQTGEQAVCALALGPDGLYFAPLLPAAGDTSPVLRVRPDANSSHPHRPDAPIAHLGCRACHVIAGAGGLAGPSLERDALRARLAKRLASTEYAAQVARVDAIDAPPFSAWRQARAEVLKLEGEARVRAWVVNRLMEPKFDDPSAQMPNLGITRAQAEALSAELLGPPGEAASAAAEADAPDHDDTSAVPRVGNVEGPTMDRWLDRLQAAVLVLVGFALGFVVAARRKK